MAAMRVYPPRRTGSGSSRRSSRLWRSVTVGIWVENGSRYERARAGGHLALPRAPVLQGHDPPHGGADRRRDRRRRRRAERLHRQGVHLLLREGPATSTCRSPSTCLADIFIAVALRRAKRSTASGPSSSRRSRRSRTRPTTTSTICSTRPSGRATRSARPIAGTPRRCRRFDARRLPAASSARATGPIASWSRPPATCSTRAGRRGRDAASGLLAGRRRRRRGRRRSPARGVSVHQKPTRAGAPLPRRARASRRPTPSATPRIC